MEWQRIDTAPKDGTHILLGYLDKSGWFAVRSGLWHLVHARHSDKDWAYAWVCTSMQTLIDQRATHWMSMPESPEIAVDATEVQGCCVRLSDEN